MLRFLLLALACHCQDGGPEASLVAEVLDKPATSLASVAATELPEIAPVLPGELTPPPGASGDGLQVLLVGPQDRQSQPPVQAVAIFDRPMVALGQLDATAAQVPLSCEGAQGKARWAGTATAVWLPEGGRFPHAAEIRCSIPAGTHAVDGTTLANAITFSFHTTPPQLSRSEPTDGGDGLDPAQGLLLVFDQAVDPAAVQKLAKLVDSAGKAVTLSAARPVEGPDRRLPKDLTRAVELKGALARDTGYTLTLPAGLLGMEGSLGTEAASVIRFRTIPPARIQGHGPQGAAVSPYARLELNLSTITSGAELNSRVHISPTPPDGFKPAEDYETRWWSYGTRLQPMTTYTVSVDAGAKDIYGQTVAEPVSWTFTTGHLEPMVQAPVGSQLYPANNPTILPIRSRNVSVLLSAANTVDASWLAQNLTNWSVWAPNAARLSSGPATPLRVNVGEFDDVVHASDFDLAPYLQDGKGLVMVEFWSPELRNWDNSIRVMRAVLQVTDLGTSVKFGPDGATVWVTRLSDGTAVKGATVELWLSSEGSKLASGTTDDQGLFVSKNLNLPKNWSTWSDPLVAVVRSGSDTSITGVGNPNGVWTYEPGVTTGSPTEAQTVAAHMFLDRGVYRPGDTVHAAFTARIADRGGLSLPTNMQYSWICRDYDGKELGSAEGPLSGGGAAFDITLPDEMALGAGSCRVELMQGDTLSGSTVVEVPVYAYRAPSFRVEVSAPEHATAGGTLSATGHGRYLFGAAMAGAEAKWSVRAQDIQPEIPGYDGYRFAPMEDGAWWYEGGGYAETSAVASGEAKLSADGSLPIEVKIPKTEEPKTQRYEVEVTVTDVDRQRISNRAELVVDPAEVYVGLRALNVIGEASKPVTFELVALTPEGKGAENSAVELQISRRSWDTLRQKGMDGRWQWVSTPHDDPVETRSVKAGGKATRVEFTPKDAGFYVASATVRDSQGRLTRAEDGLYVAGPGAAWARDEQNRVDLVPDKLKYKPGETAKLLVKAPKAGMRALVTVEREGVLARQVLTLKSTADTVEIPLGEDAVPNVYVSVLLVDGAAPVTSPDGGVPQHYLGYKRLDVDPAGRRLSVKLSPNQDVYKPGEEVSVTVDVARDGKVVSDAHVILYAVDHGVLSLTGYELPDPFAEYYAQRDLRVLTADNRTTILNRADYLAKGADSGGGGGQGPQVRSKFETTPYWNAALRTDAQGKVNVKFKLPDNLTTFRLMAVVDQGADAFGGAEQEIRVSQPLIARPALPRVLRTNDRALAGIVVHNNRDTEREVAVTADAKGVTLRGSPTKVKVPARGAVEVVFAITNPIEGTATFLFDVQSGEDRDRVEVSLPVLEPQISETVATAGVAEPSASETIALVDGASPGVGGLSVQVAPTVLIGADTALGYLVDYPHGCLEQTSSRLLALLVAKELGPRAGAALPTDKVDAYIEAGFTRLNGFKHPSGGFTYWPGERYPSVLGTAAAVEVLQRGGRPVDPATVRFLREALAGKWTPSYMGNEELASVRARVALALARIGQGDAGFNARTYERRDKLSVTAKAELAEAIARTSGPDSRTADLVRRFEGAVVVESSATTIRDNDQDRWLALWEGEMSPTAAGLSALLYAAPDDPLVARLARGLVISREHGRWSNTYVTARAFAALADYVGRFEKEPATKVKVSMAGGKLLEAAFSADKIMHTAKVPMAELKPGTLSIEGDGRVYYESRLAYSTPTTPARDEGFTLVRTMEIIEGTGNSGSVTPGALIKVTLRVTTTRDRYDVAVLDPLPAGLEPVDTFFKTTASTMVEEDEAVDSGWGGYYDTGLALEPTARTWSDWVFNHREMRDDAVALYATYMPAGIHVYSYYARATTPGDYAQPAASIEEMYRPEVFGRTESGRFVVGTAPVAQAEGAAPR